MMKSLKMFFSSLLVLLSVCQVSQAQASNETILPVYRDVIGDISLRYEGAMLAGDITLASGLIMHINDYKIRDDNVINTWRPGDVVGFKSYLKEDAHVLSVRRIYGPDEEKVEPYVICDVITSPFSGLIIVEINDNGKFVKLNDGSVWEFGWYQRFSTKHWSAFERVLVSGDGSKNSYSFINLDAPVQKNVAKATGTFVIQ